MAGVSAKAITTRIRTLRSTRQITKAMEMVASSKLRRAQARIVSSRPYFNIIYGVIQDIAAANREHTLPYLACEKNCADKITYVVIAGDRGLAGGYNSNILNKCYAETAGCACEVLPIGKKAVDFFSARGTALLSTNYAGAEHVDVGDCFTLARSLCRRFRHGECKEVRIGYTNFASVLTQTPVTLKLLPLEGGHSAPGASADILYEPSSEEVFETIIPEYIGGVIYGALCESRASEQAARRGAMDTATQNADDMIADLSLKYNRARQAAITQEITEIVAGSQS